MKKTLLILSETKSLYYVLEAMLGTDRYNIRRAEKLADSVALVERHTVNLIVSTAKTQSGSVFDFLKKIREPGSKGAETPVILLTEQVTSEIIRGADEYEVADTVKLPLEPIAFCKRVEELIAANVRPYEKPDAVTGLHKKQFAEEQIAEMLEDGKKGALFLVDLDHYSFASSFVSDAARIACRDVLLSFGSEEDVVASAAAGGFVVFAPEMRKKEEIEEYAEKIIKGILEKVIGESIYVSLGMAVTDRHGTGYQELYLNCDLGLGRARQSGKNKAFFYNW